MLNKTITTSIDTQAARLRELQARVEKVNNLKVAAEMKSDLLKKQYDELIQKIRQKGVESIDDLPQTITRLEQEINQELDMLEQQVVAAEQLMNQLQ